MSQIQRFQSLNPLTVGEKVLISKCALYFFSPSNNSQLRKNMNLCITEGTIEPFCVSDFFKWYENYTGDDLHKKLRRILEVFSLLEKNGLLEASGTSSSLGRSYFHRKEYTTIEKKGDLFLGKYLGLEITATLIKKNIVHITGEDNKGNERSGTGILISSNVILTCAHVIKDMKIHKELSINEVKYKIKDEIPHETVDMGIITLQEPICESLYCADIALRNSFLLEKIIIAGFPVVPFKKDGGPIIQSGEICGSIETIQKEHPELELFTAISRPGNSGGPIISADGKILGIVIQNLEGKYTDSSQSDCVPNEQKISPFFAALPSRVIKEKFNELNLSEEYSLPWEDYT